MDRKAVVVGRLGDWLVGCVLLMVVMWLGGCTSSVTAVGDLRFADGQGGSKEETEMRPVNLRCEYRVNPLGVDEQWPRLSWEVGGTRRGAAQTAYQIQVSEGKDSFGTVGRVLWDSGKVNSGQSIQVPYSGPALKSGQACYWRVRTWNEAGQVSTYSDRGYWSMGLLDEGDWSGKWVGRDEAPAAKCQTGLEGAKWVWYPEGNAAKSAAVGQIFFRRTVTIPDDVEVKLAEAVLTVDNEFTFYTNGQLVGIGSEFRSAAAYDLKDYLKAGDNVLAVAGTNIGGSANPAGMIGRLHIELDNGETLDVSTDEEWLTSADDVAGWESVELDDSGWKRVRAVGEYGALPWGEITLGDSDARVLPARMLRRDFNVGKDVARATVYICGLGYYELQINGEKVGDSVLDPGLTDYSKRVLYSTFDVTDMLCIGGNAIGVMLGNGRYYAPRSSVPIATVDYGYPKLLLQLHIEYTDGIREDVVSDESWRLTTNGPIRANNDYDGEFYDARMEQDGWSEADFYDADWEDVQLVESPGGKIVSQMAEPMRVTRIVQPIQITEPQPGVYVYDMGQNLVGWVRLKVDGPRGTPVKMRFAERLDDDGTLFVANLRSCKVTDTYILKGDGPETYEPRFTYHGFRYVELSGFPGKPSMDALEGRVIHSAVAQTGAFSCSNELINRLHENILWGVRGNLRSIPTDCPQRDERQGWLGDIANQAKAEMCDFNMASFFAKWMDDIQDSQTEKGSIPDVAPAFWRIYSNNMTWPSAYLIIPQWYYEHYADKRLIERHYPAMCKWIDHMAGYVKDGLMPRDQYGDWCVPPESPELIHSRDSGRKTAGSLLGTAYYYYDLMLLAKYAAILGKTDDVQKYSAAAEEVRRSFNGHFLNSESNLYDNGSQTACVLPLAFGIVPDECRAGLFENLVNSIVEKCEGHIGTGLVGGQWLMRSLSDMGRADVAYQLATCRTYPSWGYMVDKGATTVWELWNGDSANPAMNSGNHLMLVGDLGIWMYEYLAGIRPNADYPGFARFDIAPVCLYELDWVRAEIGSMHGRIRSAWWREGSRLFLEVTVPPNTRARVRVPVPDGEEATISEGSVVLFKDGEPVGSVEGVSLGKREADCVWFDVVAGRYRFMVEGGEG